MISRTDCLSIMVCNFVGTERSPGIVFPTFLFASMKPFGKGRFFFFIVLLFTSGLTTFCGFFPTKLHKVFGTALDVEQPGRHLFPLSLVFFVHIV
jgi:hypothetical protein